MYNTKAANIIIWDWNGTLLNDVDHCIRSMNRLLLKRNLPFLEKQRYLEVFTFPVRNYYLSLGFDFATEPFEIPAEEFVLEYQHGFENVELYEGVERALEFFKNLGKHQYILSAMEHDALIKSVKERNIHVYFNNINGINNNLAYGKTELAKQIIEKNSIDKSKAVWIGDTLHDAEVAHEMGISTILIASGHQSRQRLEKSGHLVLDSLQELVMYFSK